MLSLQLRLLVLAVAVFTRLPISARLRGWTQGLAAPHGLRYLPLAGLLAALPMAVAYAIAGIWLPHAVALLLALGAGLLLTGALHESAFTAWCDEAAGGTRNALGPAGAIGVTLLLLTRFETLSSIDPSWVAVSMVCAAAFSRGCAVFLLGTLAGADEGPERGVQLPDGLDTGIALAGAALPVAAAALWTGDAGVFGAAAGMALASAAIGRRVSARRGLGAGPVALGALQQLAELGFYIGILATLSIIDETFADPSS